MTPILFKQMQRDLRDEGLLGASDTVGTLTVAGEAALFGAAAFGLAMVDRWSLGFWLLQLVCGSSLFRWFVILHECGHKTLFSKLWVNSVVGHLASVFCLIPYFSWRNVHLLHHRWVGVIDKDPTQKDLLRLHNAGKTMNGLFKVIWKLWLPIPFAKFLFEVFWLYPLERARSGDRRNMWQGLVSVAVCVAAHAALAWGFGLLAWASYFLPMLLVFYFVIENVNLPQHSELFPYLSDTHPDPIPFAQQDDITRSTHLPDWLGMVLCLNFNRHTEHHLFPAAPWHSLNKVRDRLLAAGYRHPHEVEFMRFMWQLRRRDPLTIYRDALPKPAGAAHE